MPPSVAQRSTYCSAAMRKLHRDFERGRKLALVPRGGVAKKSSAPPPLPRRSAPIRPAPAGAAIKKSSAPLPPPRSASTSRSPRSERVLANGGVAKKSSAPPPPRRSAPIPPAPAGASIKKSSAPLPPPRSASTSRSPRSERVLAKGGVAKKSSAPPPPRRSAPIPPAPAGAAIKKSSAPLPPPRSASISRSPRRCGVLAPLTPPLPSSAASGSIRKGAQVRVRTPTGILPTGQRLVLWLSAVVVSAAEEGYLEVVYNGNFPRDDPFRTMRVARDQVIKNVPPADSSAAPAVSAATAAVPRLSSAKGAPRPTIAGKSLPVLKKLEKEMRRHSESILAAW